MQLPRQPAKRRVDVRIAGVTLDTERLIVIRAKT
jgi:hypothetical protein